MKKTNKILLVILLVIILIVIGIFVKENISSKTDYRDFAVADTASITKIFLADKNNETVTLERKDSYWTVNKDFIARRDFVNILLATIKDIEISSHVPEKRISKVLTDISVSGIKVEIYNEKKILKTYYVGGVTDDNTGTYMIMEGSDIPFIMRIPGFNGYLTIRYIPSIDEWKERDVFNYKFNEITKISVEYPHLQDESFIINSYGNNKFDITNIDGTKVNFDFDTIAVKEYISKSKYMGFEAFIIDTLQQFKIDSLKQYPPRMTIQITDTNNKVRKLASYRRQNLAKYLDDDGKLYEWDIDRLYGIIDDKEIVILQYYVLDQISAVKYDFKKNDK